MTLKCFNTTSLKSFISSSYDHTLDNKPNGQSMYKFPNGLVLNVYDTGSCVFQGAETAGKIRQEIENYINAVNAPFIK